MSIFALMRFLLLPISFIYGLIIKVRNLFFDWGIFKSKSYNIPIICIGNITVGGTGKTPHIEYLLNILSDKKTVVLSRGYGRKSKGFFLVNVKSNPTEVGDESLQIKQKYPNTIVAVSENRRKGIDKIINDFPETEVILMDDGFQHRWVNASLNIILNNFLNPYYTDYFLPSGRLRDSEISTKRADIIITSKTPKITETEKKITLSNLNLHSFQEHFFSSIFYQDFKHLFNKSKIISGISGFDITLITSIADNESIINFLKKSKNRVNSISFKDHHNYTQKDIQKILLYHTSANSEKSIILTTEKDKVKLSEFKEYLKNFDIYYLPIKIEVDEENKLKEKIRNHVTNYKEHS